MATSTATIRVLPDIPLSVSITADLRTGKLPLTVTFAADASGGVDRYDFTWDFGDGGGSHGTRAVHTFTTPGRYTVTVFVRDSLGQTQSTTYEVNVAGPQPPSVTRPSPWAVAPGRHSLPRGRLPGGATEKAAKGMMAHGPEG